MSDSNLKTASILSSLIVVLMITAAAGGLLLDNLYQDNFHVTSGWLGNDLVTLFVATPLLAAAVFYAQRGSWRAYLVWMGVLDYTLYNFCFYLFGGAFNSFFLIYTAIFTLSVFALIFGLAACDARTLAHQVKASLPARAITIWMAIVAVFLGGFWTAQSLGYVFTDQVPGIMETVAWPTNVTGALDLSLVVSINALGAVWLWRRNPWGVVVAAVANVKGAVYMMALAAATITAVQTGATDEIALVGLWGVIGVGCLAASVALLSGVRTAAAAPVAPSVN